MSVCGSPSRMPLAAGTHFWSQHLEHPDCCGFASGGRGASDSSESHGIPSVTCLFLWTWLEGFETWQPRKRWEEAQLLVGMSHPMKIWIERSVKQFRCWCRTLHPSLGCFDVDVVCVRALCQDPSAYASLKKQAYEFA